MTVLNIENVSLEREGTAILRDVSWRIAAGEHWALVGANGCGKTTLLKVATGYEWPTSGRVEVLGERYGETNIPALRRHIGWVSSAVLARVPNSNRVLDVAVSGFEASMGLYREFSADEYEAARCALARVGAEGIAARAWGVLSQGERQRCLIARALVARPSLMILDEPCAGLDPAARAEFLDSLERMAEEENAPGIVIVTHHVEEVRPFVTRVLAMKEGRILAQGQPEGVLRSEVLTEVFRRACVVRKTGTEYRLEMGGG
ncbi:MAG: iron complex transport system ATP-binding protein [Candidatus Sumerlaeota bacterium]|nr:iron complex transport system ATP-binding protein [Candidatus Sumerlaeota bacterium]